MNYLLNRRKAFRNIVLYKARYLFENNANDSTGDHNGTASNITYSNADGFGTGNNYYSIHNGTTSYILVSDHADLTDIKTVCAWIYPLSYGEGNFGCITRKGDNTAFLVSNAYTNTNALVFGKRFTTNNGQWTTPANSILLNTKYHVAYTYAMDDNVATKPMLYINGQSVLVSEYSMPQGDMISDTGNDFYIGNRMQNDSTFYGRIDNVALYDTVLSPTEILAIYNAENP